MERLTARPNSRLQRTPGALRAPTAPLKRKSRCADGESTILDARVIASKCWFGAAVVLLVVATAACASTARGGPSSPTHSYSVRGQTIGAPIGCSGDQVAHRIAELLQAMGSGRANAVRAFFDDSFLWFTNAPFVARRIEDVVAYSRRLRAAGEHLSLLSITFNGWERERNLVHFGPISVHRSSGGISSSSLTGKGAYDCASDSIVVLSLGPVPNREA